MKKREFQKKAAAALLGKLADVVMELEENPNITITSEYHSSYFKLRKNYNLIQISVKQTGELTYQLTDMLGNTGRSQIYVQYHAGDDPEHLIKKFVEDFGRLYKDFLLAGTLHDFVRIQLSVDADTEEALREYLYRRGRTGISWKQKVRPTAKESGESQKKDGSCKKEDSKENGVFSGACF